MLNQHKRIAIPLESLFIVDYLRAEPRFDLDWLKSYLVKEPELREWGLDADAQVVAECPTIASAIRRLHEIYAEQRGADVWGGKTPRLVRYLDLILQHYPTVRIVHLVRDPRAVANSLIKSDVHRSDAYHAATRWVRDVRSGLDFEATHPDISLHVFYEQMVSQPESTLARILDFLRLDGAVSETLNAQPQGLREYSEFYSNIHANLDRRPTPEFINKWRTSLSQTDQEVIEAICGRQMVELGYEPELATHQLRKGVVRRMKLRRVILTFLQTMRYLRYRRPYITFLLMRKWRLGYLREFLWNANY